MSRRGLVIGKKGLFDNKNVKDVHLFMLPYILLLFLPFLFCFIAYVPITRGNRTKRVLAIGREKEILNNSFMLPIFFIILFALLALRDESIGRDLDNYRYYFESFSSMSLKEIFEGERDILYRLLNWL